MHDMIEDIRPEGNRTKKLLFLTSGQADMIINNCSLELLLQVRRGQPAARHQPPRVWRLLRLDEATIGGGLAR